MGDKPVSYKLSEEIKNIIRACKTCKDITDLMQVLKGAYRIVSFHGDGKYS